MHHEFYHPNHNNHGQGGQFAEQAVLELSTYIASEHGEQPRLETHLYNYLVNVTILLHFSLPNWAVGSCYLRELWMLYTIDKANEHIFVLARSNIIVHKCGIQISLLM